MLAVICNLNYYAFNDCVLVFNGIQCQNGQKYQKKTFFNSIKFCK